MAIKTLTASGNISPTDETVFFNPSAPITVTICSPRGQRKLKYLYNLSAYTITLQSSGSTINGVTSYLMTTQYQGGIFVPDNVSNWGVVGASLEVGQDLSTTASPTFVSVNAKLNGVKVYRAVLQQVGTAAPTVTVLENSLGGTVVWSRGNIGVYSATLSGAFTMNKTWFNHETWQQVDLNGDSSTVFKFGRDSTNAMSINSVTSLDNDTPVDLNAVINIEVLVYPS